MGASNSESKSMKFYSLKAKVDETNSPHFAQTEKVDGAWKVTNQYDTISGMLDSAEIVEKEYKGAKFKSFIFVLSDDKETSKLELTHNSITHNIINCLATDCNKLNTYKIYVDKKKSKDGKYMNGRAFVTIEGQKESLKWSIDPQSAPKKVAVQVNGQPFLQQGKQVWDDADLRKFWEGIFVSKIQNVLGALKPIGATTPTNVAATNSTSPVFTGNVDDNMDLPF